MPSSMFSSDGRRHHHRRGRQHSQHSSPPPPHHRHPRHHHQDDTESCCSSSSSVSSCTSARDHHHRHSHPQAVVVHPRSKEINRDRYALAVPEQRYYDDDGVSEGVEEEYVVNPGHRYEKPRTGYQHTGHQGRHSRRDTSLDSYESERERKYRRRKKERGLLVAAIMFVAGVVLCFVD